MFREKDTKILVQTNYGGVCENKYGGYGKECKNIRLNVIKNEPHVNTKLKTGKITFPESLKKCLSRRIFFPKVLIVCFSLNSGFGYIIEIVFMPRLFVRTRLLRSVSSCL